MAFWNYTSLSRVNRSLIVLDWLFAAAWNIAIPILAVFVTLEIGGSIADAGYVIALGWVAKAVFVIPLGAVLDRKKGEHDDWFSLLASTILGGGVAVGFAFAYSLPIVFGLQILQGFSQALYSAAWPSIFTRHLAQGNVSRQWSFDIASIAVITGVAGVLGGYLTNRLGFRVFFLVVAAMSIGASIPVLRARHFMVEKE